MQWYTLDSALRRDSVIEDFESFIWTERYSTYGDFSIVIKSTLQSRNLLTTGTWITRAGSTYVAIIETVEDATDDSGTRNLTVSGRFLEALLDDRVAMPTLTDTTTQPNWVLTDTPGNIIRTMFTTVCVDGGIDAKDSIPFYHSGTLLPAGGLDEDSSIITVTAAPDTLYNTIQKIANTYFLGFRFVKDGDAGNIYFEVYVGTDLTSDQTDNPPVIFDPNLDNLEDINQLTSTQPVKTVAYVFATNGSATVYATTADPDAVGADRRVLLVNSSNSADAGPDLDSALQAEGQLALASQRILYQFTGELPQNIPYVYGVDYHLGDKVEERSSDGIGNQMLVTEQIFSSDNTGERQYPTLTITEVITPGTWVAYDPTIDWSEEDDSVHWSDIGP
jgi:Siphovirus ReqiPepy6 Gp37-like protein